MQDRCHWSLQNARCVSLANAADKTNPAKFYALSGDTLTVNFTDPRYTNNTSSDTAKIATPAGQNPPVNIVPGPQTATEGLPLAITGISVTDTLVSGLLVWMSQAAGMGWRPSVCMAWLVMSVPGSEV